MQTLHSCPKSAGPKTLGVGPCDVFEQALQVILMHTQACKPLNKPHSHPSPSLANQLEPISTLQLEVKRRKFIVHALNQAAVFTTIDSIALCFGV